MFKTLISAAKAIVSVVALVLAFTVNASAQDRSAEAAKKMADNMKTELSLTDAQYNKVLDLNKNFSEKAAEARKSSTDKKQTAQAVKALNEEREKGLKTILTEDQFKTYLLKKEEKKKAAVKRFENNEGLRVRQNGVTPNDINTDAKVKSVEKQ